MENYEVIHRTIPLPSGGFRHVAEMAGHTYDGNIMKCPVDLVMRYAGHHQFVCSHGVWNVGGRIGSRYDEEAVGEGENRHVPTIHSHLDNVRLAMLAEVKRLRTRAAWSDDDVRNMGRTYVLDLDEASPDAVDHLQKFHPRDYAKLSAR